MTEEFALNWLKRELVPALGCTEPITIAYCAAQAARSLGETPDRIVVACSGNMLKNARCVIVPGTTLYGIEASAILGALYGHPERKMEVLENLPDTAVQRTRELLQQGLAKVALFEEGPALHVLVEVFAGENHAAAEIAVEHMNLVYLSRNGDTLFQKSYQEEKPTEIQDTVSLHEIIDFAKTVELNKLEDILKDQIQKNVQIAERGLAESYGARVGQIILKHGKPGLKAKTIAYAAAGSDARMSGCTLPVVINSGSGNQGMTVSLPVVIYGRETKAPKEKVYRALALANLTSLYEKEYVGRLSAYCGAVSAAAGALAGIAFLREDSENLNFRACEKKSVNS